MKISKEEVQHVARLARLELTQDEVERMTGQLDAILSYVAKLDELDTSEVSVTTQGKTLVNAFREDEVRVSLPRNQALANGPAQNEEFFIVPKVIG
jgi:aspartyl-tRNA(Asn)/glutamyl-tRNA(Gln) amidotransferase subunit C